MATHFSLANQNVRANDFNVVIATKLLFGNNLMLNVTANNTGLNFGSLKVYPFDNYATFQDIARINYNELKTIGSIKRLPSFKFDFAIIIFYLMALTFTQKDVSWS